MASYIPDSSNKFEPGFPVHRQSTRSTTMTPVHHPLTTVPIGRQNADSEYLMRRGISHSADYSSGEEHECGLGLWQLEGTGDTMPKLTARRVCHVCGVHMMPQSCCPSCGHPLCGSCAPEVLNANGLKGVDEGIKKIGQMSPVKHNPFVVADQIARSKTPRSRTHGSNISAPLSKPPKFDLAHHDKPSHEGSIHTFWDDQPGRLSHSHTYSPVGGLSGHKKSNSLVDKPTTTTKTLSSLPAPASTSTTGVDSISKLPVRPLETKLLALPTSPSQPTAPVAARRRQFESALQQPSNSETDSKINTNTSLPTSIAEESKKQPGAAAPTKTDTTITGESSGGSSSSSSSTSRVRVRASSPPAWLRYSDSGSPSKSGSIPEKLRTREGLRSSLLGSEGDLLPVYRREGSVLVKGKGKEKEKETEPTSVPASGTGVVAGWMPSPLTPSRMVGQKRETGSGLRARQSGGGNFSTLASAEADTNGVAGVREEKEGGEKATGTSISVLAELDDASAHVAPLRRLKPSQTDVATSTGAGKEEGMSLSGATSEVKNGGVATNHHHENGEREEDVDEDEVGIEGLTIVLHLKGKDDLVISADLTRTSG